jgi:Outer membrane protein beta-barrel domain
MLRIFFTFSLLLLLNQSYGQVSFGVKTGLNISNVKFDGLNHSARLGMNAGVLSSIKLSKQFLLQPEVIYSTKGYKFPSTGLSGKGTLSLNYINIPILLGFKPIDKLVVNFGPEIGFLTAAKSKFDNSTVDLKEIYQKVDIGLDLGAAYNLSKQLSIDVRYNYGFKDLIKATFEDVNGNFIEQKKIGSNRVLQIGLFYLFTQK